MNAQWIQFVFLSEKTESVTRILPSAYADKAIIFVTLFPSGFKDIPYVLLRFFEVEIAGFLLVGIFIISPISTLIQN